MAVRATDVVAPDGRRIGIHDGAPDRPDLPAVLWHHGTLKGGGLGPLAGAARRSGLRCVGIDRPGHGSSTPRPGRTVAASAEDAVIVADTLDLDRFAVMGHSAGAPHALACAALLPDRVTAAVALAVFAPPDSSDLDWFAGLDPAAVLSFRAAQGRREDKLAFDLAQDGAHWQFPAVDLAPGIADLTGAATRGTEDSDPIAARVDDHIALVSPWGCDVAAVRCPTLLVHGEGDLFVPATHARWLSSHVPGAVLWESPEDGHLSILRRCDAALEWVRRRVA